jgi:hypothetical protein
MRVEYLKAACDCVPLNPARANGHENPVKI